MAVRRNLLCASFLVPIVLVFAFLVSPATMLIMTLGSHFVIRSSDQSQRWADELEAFVEVSNMVDSEGRLKKRRIDSELILYYSLIVFSVFTVSFTLSIALCFTIIA